MIAKPTSSVNLHWGLDAMDIALQSTDLASGILAALYKPMVCSHSSGLERAIWRMCEL